MKSLRRYNLKNRDYFITVVTYKRTPILLKDIDLFWECWELTNLKAWVILPDHFHAILNNGNYSISEIIHRFKVKYIWHFNRMFSIGRIWQNRFWDHIIRDDVDLKNHFDYIHYNPVKHSITNNPFCYKYSSIHKFFNEGYYSRDWGVRNNLYFKDNYGE